VLKSVLKSGFAVAAAVLLGRVLGFGRDATVAATFGIDRSADIAVFLIGLPDFLINVLGAGGFTAILVVHYRQKPAEAARLMFQAGLAVLLGVGALALVLIALRGGLVDALAPGFDAAARERTVDLLPLVLLSAPIAAMTGASIGFLQAKGRFFVAACGAAIINTVLIAAMLGAQPGRTLSVLAAAILAGALLRWLVQAAVIGREGIGGIAFRPWLVDRSLMKAFVRAAATEAVVFFYPFALRAIATLFGVGALASVNYATKLVQLPLGVVVMTLTTILLPQLAGLAPRERNAADLGPFRRLAVHGQFWILVLSAMAVAVLVVHGSWLVRLAFGWGEIGPDGLAAIASFTAVFSLSLLPMGLNVFLRRALNALGETKSPMSAEIAGFATFIASAFAVIAADGPLEAVLLCAAGGCFVSMVMLLAAMSQRGVPLVQEFRRPGLWAAVVLSALATAAPGLILERLAPGHAWLPAIAIALGGLAGLCAALAVNREARAAVRTLLPRRQ
jgi:peptidoglycan biosynthesis protein MviN/MurJ (putative lipid II flippase)